eukprot:COSAG04_NODE_464_length_13939_cov_11.061922_12_plen_104_part_00
MRGLRRSSGCQLFIVAGVEPKALPPIILILIVLGRPVLSRALERALAESAPLPPILILIIVVSRAAPLEKLRLRAQRGDLRTDGAQLLLPGHRGVVVCPTCTL